MSTLIFCDYCSDVIAGDPVRDPVSVSWIDQGAAWFCSVECWESSELRAIDAEGGVS